MSWELKGGWLLADLRMSAKSVIRKVNVGNQVPPNSLKVDFRAQGLQLPSAQCMYDRIASDRRSPCFVAPSKIDGRNSPFHIEHQRIGNVHVGKSKMVADSGASHRELIDH